MTCPHCKGKTITKKLQICIECGAEEVIIPGFEYKVWKLNNGRIVASPDAEEAKVKKNKEDWPTGDWK